MTVRKTARFKVASDRVEEALDAIRRFVAHTESEPGTTVYASWQSSENPTDFLHLMEFVDEEAESAHRSSHEVTVFTDALYSICEQPPTFTDWREIT